MPSFFDGGMEIIMYKLQMKFQGIIAYVTLAAAALTFIYSLGVSTNAYSLRTIEALSIEIPGMEMFYEMQPFNKSFTTNSIALILLAVAGLIANNHKRRKYYIANYCTIALSSLANIAVALWAFANVFDYKAKYLAVDYSNLSMVPEQVLKDLKIDVTTLGSTFWFDISIFVLSVLILASLLNIANMIFKIYVMREEKRLLKEGD